ncbi:potassium transporter 7-like isoform X1 [Nymphaea colorata]|nr:potassium transporter 7-like isoform X1 [Nymphaea colorata]XP_031486948.1 potassium transporter 7-like isoform X1 [Nymphaea colorata]
MDEEAGISENESDDQVQRKSYYKNVLLLAYQSCGVVYGDLSISPLYVFSSAFSGRLHLYESGKVIFGVLSLIFWTLTVTALLKYVFIVLSAGDNGEGGTFALYSLLCRHASLNLLPDEQDADEELSTYYGDGHSSETVGGSPLKRFLDKHKRWRTGLLLAVLFGACMVIGDGVLTPAISVLSSISGLHVRAKDLPDGTVLVIACLVLVGLFTLQHCGTHRVAFMFAPIIIVWLLSIAAIGLYNIIRWNPRIWHALSPVYMFDFFRETGKDGWISLGGVLLCVTGAEAMFADVGHFTSSSIRLAFSCVIYPCLVLQYMGQAAFLSKHFSDIPKSFYDSIPEPIFWPIFTVATLAAIVASQAVISATFSIIMQCHALGYFPRVKIIHTSSWIYGQVYIPEINWILMMLCLATTIGFHDTTLIGNAYGIACITVMFVTTCLMALVIVFVWRKSFIFAVIFLLFFGLIEALYLSSSITKVAQGGWAPLVLSVIFVGIMYVWHYGMQHKYLFELQNKVSMKWILTLGPNLGIVRVPGMGLIYTELASGVPPIFSHFVTNLPAFHQILVFICVKYVSVPYVSPEERYLIGRIGPKAYRMYRCIVRYGYKDVHRDEENNFENQLVMSIAEFIRMEVEETQTGSSSEGPWAVHPSGRTCTTMVMSETEDGDLTNTECSSKSVTTSGFHQQLGIGWRVRFELSEAAMTINPEVKEELRELVEAKEAGLTYIMGHAYIKAMKSSSFIKKLAIDIVFSFLRKNCRRPAVALNIPHMSLIEVGMIYYV